MSEGKETQGGRVGMYLLNIAKKVCVDDEVLLSGKDQTAHE